MLKLIKGRAFSLVELMVIVSIAAILVTFSYSVYKNYVMRSKVTEAVKVLEEYQAIASTLRSRSGSIGPYYVLFTDNDTTGFVSGSPGGSSAVKSVGLKYVSTISADSGTSGSNNYILLGAGMVQDGNFVAGADHVYIVGLEDPNGVVTWQCGISASKGNTVASDYLPKSCQNSLP